MLSVPTFVLTFASSVGKLLCMKVEINGNLELLEKYYLDYLYCLVNSYYNLHFNISSLAIVGLNVVHALRYLDHHVSFRKN